MLSPSSSRWKFAGLTALVVLNALLIALLVLRPAAPVGEEGEAARVPDEQSSTAPVKREPAPLPSSTEAFSPNAVPAERILVNADASTAWRATTGTCASPGSLERSVDGGQTWEELPVELSPVVRLRVLDMQSLVAIGGGEECEPTYVASSTAGDSWTTDDQYLEGSWYLAPADSKAVATPVGEIAAPCEAAELAALDAFHAALLCTDMTLNVTADGGGSWTATETQLDALTIGVAEEGYILAGLDDSCDGGIALREVDTVGSASGEEVCADVQLDAPAELAVAAKGGAIWLWVADDVLVSTDGGRSW